MTKSIKVNIYKYNSGTIRKLKKKGKIDCSLKLICLKIGSDDIMLISLFAMLLGINFNNQVITTTIDVLSIKV